MSEIYAGWDALSAVACLRERVEAVEAMCVSAMDGGRTAAELAEEIMDELTGGCGDD